MKEAWLEMTLSEVCRFINGRAYKKDELLSEGKYRVLRVGNFFTNDHWYYSNLELEEDKYCDNGDLLYAWSASFGPRIWEEEKVIYHYHIWKLEPKENLVTKEYLFHLLEWDKEKIKIAHGTGTTMMHVSKGSMEQRVVPIPPLQEQQQIVTILDEVFAAIDQAKANIEKNIANAKELFQSKLNAIFSQKGEGWEEKSLGGMSKIMYGCTAKVVEKGNVQYLRITDIQEGEVNWEDVPYISISEEDKVKYGLIIGDIVFARTGATTGKSYLITEDNLNAVFASYLIRVQIDKIVLRPAFLSLFFQSGIYWKIVNNGISGSAQGGFNASKLGDMVIHFPIDQNAQDRIVEEMETFKKNLSIVIDNLNIKLKSLDELKNSILQKAFSGELTSKKLDVA